jgi:hypothetical protein
MGAALVAPLPLSAAVQEFDFILGQHAIRHRNSGIDAQEATAAVGFAGDKIRKRGLHVRGKPDGMLINKPHVIVGGEQLPLLTLIANRAPYLRTERELASAQPQDSSGTLGTAGTVAPAACSSSVGDAVHLVHGLDKPHRCRLRHVIDIDPAVAAGLGAYAVRDHGPQGDVVLGPR